MRVVGLMSGTSVDGIDAVLVEISGTTADLTVTLLANETVAYPADLREQILSVCSGAALPMFALAQLDDAIAYTFAQAAHTVQSGRQPAALIGSHGQTVYHRPPGDEGNVDTLGYSLQLGRGDLIAAQTGIPTVSNFRAADIAKGGHGAPLVPAIDRYLLADSTSDRCVQNIGGIGNVTYIPALGQTTVAEPSSSPSSQIKGWDTGPGNALLDLAVDRLSKGQMTFDADGAWAATGSICHDLVDQWLQHPYFHLEPPKSTGRELFGQAYLHQCFQDAKQFELSAADILATITELTVASIEHSYRTFLPQMPDQVLVCGGGSHNRYLLERLRSRLSLPIMTTDEVGVSADFKEAIAFGVLAYWRWLGIPGNLPVVTGARHAVPLGDLHIPPQFDVDGMKILMEKMMQNH